MRSGWRRPLRPLCLLAIVILFGSATLLGCASAAERSPSAAAVSNSSPVPRRHGKQPLGAPDGKWTLTFDEEFSERSAAELLRSGRWHFGWFGNGGLTCTVNCSFETAYDYRPLFRVSHGIATFITRPNFERLSCCGRGVKPNLASMIDTDPLQGAHPGYETSYGYVEARMWLPDGSPSEHVWPGWWLNGAQWPQDAEIDVLEGSGTDTRNCWNVHYGPRTRDISNLNGSPHCATVTGATSGWHTYGADIRPDGITWYYDGSQVGSYRGVIPAARRYLVIGASTRGILSSDKDTRVDYIRVWHEAAATAAGGRSKHRAPEAP